MATYYVSTATGDDGDDGLSEANAFATLGQALLTVAAGDKVYVKADGNYNETMVVGIAGTQTLPIVFEGYTTTPGDGGVATIHGQSTRTTGFTPLTTSNFYVLKNLRFTGHTTGPAAGNATGDYVTYKKCRFDNTASGDGVQGDLHCLFEGCYAHNNGGDGFDIGGFSTFIACISNDNTLNGFSSEGGVYWQCIAASNGADGFVTTQATFHVLINCTVDGDNGDTGDAFDVATSFGQSDVVVVNCVAYDCEVGFRSNADLNSERPISRNNLNNDNVTPYTNFQTQTGEITDAPEFVDEAARDYGVTNTSPLKDSGFGPATNGWVTLTGSENEVGSVAAAGGEGLNHGWGWCLP